HRGRGLRSRRHRRGLHPAPVHVVPAAHLGLVHPRLDAQAGVPMSTPKQSDQPATPGKPSLAAKIESESSHPLAWKTVATRAAMVLVAGVALYLVFPAITEVLASWPRLSTLN